MPEKQEKKSSGAGKFFLGAAIGAAVGAIASKFIKFGTDDGEEIEEDFAEEIEPENDDKPKNDTKPKNENQSETNKKSEPKTNKSAAK